MFVNLLRKLCAHERLLSTFFLNNVNKFCRFTFRSYFWIVNFIFIDMIYKVKKQVFNSKGYPVQTLYFTVPLVLVDEVLRILVSEGYTIFENQDCYKVLSMITPLHDDRTYSRYIFRAYDI